MTQHLMMETSARCHTPDSSVVLYTQPQKFIRPCGALYSRPRDPRMVLIIGTTAPMPRSATAREAMARVAMSSWSRRFVSRRTKTGTLLTIDRIAPMPDTADFTLNSDCVKSISTKKTILFKSFMYRVNIDNLQYHNFHSTGYGDKGFHMINLFKEAESRPYIRSLYEN